MSGLKSSFVWRIVLPIPLLPVVVLAAGCYRIATVIAVRLRTFVDRQRNRRPDRLIDHALRTNLAAIDAAIKALKAGESEGFAAAARLVKSLALSAGAIASDIRSAAGAMRPAPASDPDDARKATFVEIDGAAADPLEARHPAAMEMSESRPPIRTKSASR